MSLSGINLIGHIGYYRKIPVYHDEYRQPVLSINGPLEKEELPNIVYMNQLSGRIYTKTGEPFVYKRVKRGIKAFIVNDSDLDIARLLIKISLFEDILNNIKL